MPRYYRNCGAAHNENDHFYGDCGAPTRHGLKKLDTSENLGVTLNQLERSYQAKYISKERYEEYKARYSEELAKVNEEIEKHRPVVPSNAAITPSNYMSLKP